MFGGTAFGQVAFAGMAVSAGAFVPAAIAFAILTIAAESREVFPLSESRTRDVDESRELFGGTA